MPLNLERQSCRPGVGDILVFSFSLCGNPPFRAPRSRAPGPPRGSLQKRGAQMASLSGPWAPGGPGTAGSHGTTQALESWNIPSAISQKGLSSLFI